MSNKSLMLRGVTFFCVISMSMSMYLHAQNDLFSVLTREDVTKEESDSILNFYYQNPRPGELVASVKSFLRDEEFINDMRHLMPVVRLVATVARNDSTVLESLKSMKEDYNGHAFDVMSEIIDQAENFVPTEPLSPFHLDFIWAEFLATGDAEPVKKIIKALDLTLPEKDGNYSEEETNIVLTVTAAQWSLTSNIRQHKRVREIVEQEAANATGRLKEKLDELLAAADSKTTPDPEGIQR